jgi:hypothetical protein
MRRNTVRDNPLRLAASPIRRYSSSGSATLISAESPGETGLK